MIDAEGQTNNDGEKPDEKENYCLQDCQFDGRNIEDHEMIFINDLPNVSKLLSFYLFADDTNIYYKSHDLVHLQRIMNRELKKVKKWLDSNQLSLNRILDGVRAYPILDGGGQKSPPG